MNRESIYMAVAVAWLVFAVAWMIRGEPVASLVCLVLCYLYSHRDRR